MDEVSTQMMAHGLAALECGKLDDAVNYFSTILEYNQDNWSCRSNLAAAYLQAGELLAARTQLLYIAEKCPLTAERQQAMSMLEDVIYQEAFSLSPLNERLPPGWLGQASS